MQDGLSPKRKEVYGERVSYFADTFCEDPNCLRDRCSFAISSLKYCCGACRSSPGALGLLAAAGKSASLGLHPKER